MANRNALLGGTDWDDEILFDYDLNDTFDAAVNAARNLLLHSAISNFKILQSNNVFENGDLSFVDEATDSNGTNNTKTGGTADFDTDHYRCAITAGSSAIAENLTTVKLTTESTTTMKTLTVNSLVYKVTDEIYHADQNSNSSSWPVYAKIKLNYSDATSYTFPERLCPLTWTAQEWINPNLSKEVSTVEVILRNPNSYSSNFNASERYTRVYDYTFSNSTVIHGSNTYTLDGTEKGLVIFGKVTNTANTSVTYDISDGTTTLSGKNAGEYIDISSLSSGTLIVTENLNTVEPSEAAESYGISGVIEK